MHTLLINAGLPGPYVLVGHSAGGMHVHNLGQFQLLKVMHFFGSLRLLPLSGEALLASLPAPIKAQVRAQRLQSGAVAALAAASAANAASIQQTTAATPLPPARPLLIVWHGIPAQPVELEPLAVAALTALLQQSENSKFVRAEQSGHALPFEQPAVVIDAVTQVVEAVRTGRPLQP